MDTFHLAPCRLASVRFRSQKDAFRVYAYMVFKVDIDREWPSVYWLESGKEMRH